MGTKCVIEIADNLVRFRLGLVLFGTRQRQNERQDKDKTQRNKDKTKGKQRQDKVTDKTK